MELYIQALGPMGFFKPDIIKTLDITEEQQKMMRANFDEFDANNRKATGLALQIADPNERRTKLDELKKKRQKDTGLLHGKMLGILTKAQRVNYDKMKGTTLDIDFWKSPVNVVIGPNAGVY